jgi:uncharacterized membrane protein (Fun14 family)
MSWLIDHANLVYILLGIVALGFVTAWWLNKRVKFLAYALLPLALIGLFWLFTRMVVTDQQQIRQHVEAMAEDVVNQDADRLFRHVSARFKYHGMDRKQMNDAVARALKLHKVGGAFISNYAPIDIDRGAGKAKVAFLVKVDDLSGNMVFFARCEAAFVLEDAEWKLSGVEFFNPVANQDQPMAIPLP